MTVRANFVAMKEAVATSLPAAFVNALRTALPPEALSFADEDRAHYGHDETEDLRFPPDVVVRARSTADVAATL